MEEGSWWDSMTHADPGCVFAGSIVIPLPSGTASTWRPAQCAGREGEDLSSCVSKRADDFFLKNFYLFMAVLGLRFCARAFSSCGKRGPLFIAVRGPLTIVASLVAEHRLQTRRPSNCGSRAQLLRGMWDLPRPGLEPVSPALAGGFSTTAPPGKLMIFNQYICHCPKLWWR